MNQIVSTAVEDRQGRRKRILALEYAIDLTGHAVHELPTRHLFAHGTYTRELTIPAGVVATGKIHRYSCINIISKGSLQIFTEEGDYEVTAPFSFVSGPGVKKAGFALTEVVWTTVHPWDGPEDLALIENELIVPSFDELEQELENKLETPP